MVIFAILNRKKIHFKFVFLYILAVTGTFKTDRNLRPFSLKKAKSMLTQYVLPVRGFVAWGSFIDCRLGIFGSGINL